MAALKLTKCLKQVKLQTLLLAHAPTSELPSDIRIMAPTFPSFPYQDGIHLSMLPSVTFHCGKL